MCEPIKDLFNMCCMLLINVTLHFEKRITILVCCPEMYFSFTKIFLCRFVALMLGSPFR